MNMKWLTALGITCVLGLGVAPAQERDGRAPGIRGVLKKIDLEVGTITLLTGGDGGQVERTYNLPNKQVPVTTVPETAVKARDLTPGLTVSLQMKDDDVEAIRVELPRAGVVVSSVDPAKGIQVRLGERGGKELAIGPETRIVVGGVPVKLGDVKFPREELTGKAASVIFGIDRKSVVVLEIGRGEGERRREGDQPQKPRRDGERPREGVRDGERARTTVGVLVDLDPGKRTLSVLTGRGDEQKLETFTVAKEAKIGLALEAQPLGDLSLSQLSKPLNVTMTLSEDLKTVARIQASPPQLRGSVKAIDGKARTITIGSEREEKTYELADKTLIRVPGKETPVLADIAANSPVSLALSLDRTRVLAVTVVRTERRDPR